MSRPREENNLSKSVVVRMSDQLYNDSMKLIESDRERFENLSHLVRIALVSLMRNYRRKIRMKEKKKDERIV